MDLKVACRDKSTKCEPVLSSFFLHRVQMVIIVEKKMPGTYQNALGQFPKGLDCVVEITLAINIDLLTILKRFSE